MRHNKKGLFFIAITIFSAAVFYACKSTRPVAATAATATSKPRILVFIKTAGFYHNSIPDGVAAIQKLGQENNFDVDSTRDAVYFNDDSLKKYSAVMFLSTTLNVLNAGQQVAFERYIEAGGGFAGVHAAADTEYDWPWYTRLLGAQFASHPQQQKAMVQVIDTSFRATSFLPAHWERFDEWYNYKNISSDINVLAKLDETTYTGGINGDKHPIAWYHTYDGGRAFYTGLGHTKESYSEPLFLKHLLGGIQYAIGEGKALDFSKSYAVKHPEDNRFVKTVLSNDLNEPMELAVASDGRVFFTERAGKFYVYEPAQKRTRLLWNFPVKAVDKYLNGLIGVTVDPHFAQNNHIYFFYTSNTDSQYHQNVSRFTITADGNLDTTSEKIIIKIPIDLEVSAHTGGSLAWDKYDNLFISTGDNTVPFQSDGYAPLDERPGRKVYDAQRSAGNPADLRGKILRIHPEENGTYTIPEGNLFQKGMQGTRPEIYVMGCRNPYRISVDTATSFVYWGEVGPDAGTDSRHGPRGYDEFNQAKRAGNFGWPYFVGASIAYHDSDFATKEIGPLYNAATGAANNSPNNTGMKTLPPPTAPMVWYPYNRSDSFPDLGNGGRCAMGGPVYHYNESLQSSTKLPAYYDKALFVYDWMRNWVFALRFDENNNYKRMEPFMQTNGDFRRPVDMEIGPDGAIYMLEYGSVYGIDNVDARLVRIDYNEGDRAPIAQITASDTIGNAPLQVRFNGKSSHDFDEDDSLSYRWSFDGSATSTEASPTFSFAHNGVYKTVLTVTDKSGQSSTDTMMVEVGNTKPLVAIRTTGNSTFFFPKPTALHYTVDVSDKEDSVIDAKKVSVILKYLSKVAPTQNAPGHQQVDGDYNFGKTLVAGSDCKACHQMNAKSVGPSFMMVSQRYGNDKNAIGYLSNKIITGGGGAWGEHAMSAHPQLSKEDAMEIVKYVLSVSKKATEKKLPQQGLLLLNQHLNGDQEGRYILTASYTDNGTAGIPLTGKNLLYLRPSKVQAEGADVVYNMQQDEEHLGSIRNGGYFVLKGIDLTEITGLTYRYASLDKDAMIQVHTDGVKGPVISTLNYTATGDWDKFAEATAAVTNASGKHDLYVVFVKATVPNNDLAALDWVRFEGGTEIVAPPVAATKKPVITNFPKKPLAEIKTTMETVASSKSPGAVLIQKSDCFTCHKQDQKLVGPSFVQIATRYKSSTTNVTKLSGKIISGGAGVWGEVPMTPHTQLSKKDAAVMVQYILSLKK